MIDLSRRAFLGSGLAAAGLRLTPLPPRRAGMQWVDVVDFPIEGRAFADRKAPYDRLPARAEAIVRKEVWDLSRDSAGMVVRFTTASSAVHVRYRLTRKRVAMAHMPATGVSGTDLYGHDGKQWRWLQVSRPADQDVEAKLLEGLEPAPARRFQLYLPLYNGIEKLEIGVDESTPITALPRRSATTKPIVCYGTSILHGASASRPGMAWAAILERALDREVFNFGFSGNGRMETEVGQFLVELEPAAFVIDCLPNMSPQLVTERTGPLVRQLRQARPKTPILLIEDRTFANAWIDAKRVAEHARRRAALRAEADKLQADGVPGLHLLGGTGLLGSDDEGTTDGSHPNDLGMMRQAEQVLAALRPLLG